MSSSPQTSSTLLKKAVREFQKIACADAKAPVRVKAVNTLLNSGYNLKTLNDAEVETLWNSLFFALWYAEMSRGCEEIIAAIERACSKSHRLTRVGFLTIAKKWYGLDQYRIDKISHLARHLLPLLIEQQIKLWIKSRKNRRFTGGVQGVRCRQLLKRIFDEVAQSYGLCYFLLEILAEEISKTLTKIYQRLCITVGKFEFKADLITFLYKQVISLAANTELDSRLLRTFDQYVIKKFIVELLPNESQLTQILVSLRLYQALDEHVKKQENSDGSKNRALLHRWSRAIQDIHERCINGDFFPATIVPVKQTIKWELRME